MLQVVSLFGDSKHPGMAYHSRPEDDPYITVHEDSDSEKDDFVLKGTDRLILAARNEDDVSHLEVRLEHHQVHSTGTGPYPAETLLIGDKPSFMQRAVEWVVRSAKQGSATTTCPGMRTRLLADA